MAKYNYIVDLSEQFEGKPETTPSEGVMGKPVTEKAEEPKSMYQEMADMLSAYWGGTDEAKARVAPGSVKEADEDEISVYTDWEEAALRSAEESAIFRMDMGITESLADPQIRKKLPEGATYRPLQRPGPVLKDAEDAPVVIPEPEPVTVKDIDAKPTGGLMARSNSWLDGALDTVLESEGGFQNDKEDTGNYRPDGTLIGTNKGITPKALAAYKGVDADTITVEDIKSVDDETARAIYKQDYYEGPGINKLPAYLRESVMDMYINAGPNAIKILQRKVGAKADGILGPATLQAIADSDLTKEDYADARIEYYTSIAKSNPKNKKYLKGWIARANKYRD